MNTHQVAVIGAGPAGISTAARLAQSGMNVALLNRDIKPGGLAEYGIYHSKHKMKEALRKQFRKEMSHENITYYGNVSVGRGKDISIEALKEMGFSAVVVATGAQGTKWLGLPGEELRGVYHAKDLVYHYNKLPPYSEMNFHIGRRVAIVGVGNVMVDIAHWLIRDVQVDSVTAIARRDATAVKFTKKEMQAIAANLDLTALSSEIERIRPIMNQVGHDVDAAHHFILAGCQKAQPAQSETDFGFRFLSSPTRILGNAAEEVIGLEIEETVLSKEDGKRTKVNGSGRYTTLDVDTVIFAIGDTVDSTLGLPTQWHEYVKHPQPCHPVKGVSYEAFDPNTRQPITGVFMAGWARQASTGLVGEAKKDGRQCAEAVLQYLQEQTAVGESAVEKLSHYLLHLPAQCVGKKGWQNIESYEQTSHPTKPGYKLGSNEEMLSIVFGRKSPVKQTQTQEI